MHRHRDERHKREACIVHNCLSESVSHDVVSPSSAVKNIFLHRSCFSASLVRIVKAPQKSAGLTAHKISLRFSSIQTFRASRPGSLLVPEFHRVSRLAAGRGLYRQWGFSPRPEKHVYEIISADLPPYYPTASPHFPDPPPYHPTASPHCRGTPPRYR